MVGLFNGGVGLKDALQVAVAETLDPLDNATALYPVCTLHGFFDDVPYCGFQVVAFLIGLAALPSSQCTYWKSMCLCPEADGWGLFVW